MEIIKKLDEFLENAIEKEGAGESLRFRMKTIYPKTGEVVSETIITPREFIMQYGQFLSTKKQLEQGKERVEHQISEKIWEQWPKQIEDIKKQLEGFEAQKKKIYFENFKEVKNVVPQAEWKGIFAKFGVDDYE